jgi:hypothetical protein
LENLEVAMEEKEIEFNKFLVEEYLKHGSVEEVFRKHRFSLPISSAGYYRVLDKWGIVKAAGPNSKLSEILNFMVHLAEEKIPVEALYKRMPPSFQTSAVTLYRILSYVKEGITRRMGTALIITPERRKDLVLIGRDISSPRLDLGKPYGALSIPMGFSRKRDSRHEAILRILQQEVFTQQAIDQKMPINIIPDLPKPFMYLDIADVRVEIFHLEIPKKLTNPRNFFSFKLKNHQFVKLDKILTSDPGDFEFRIGVKEAASGYKKYLNLVDRNLKVNPLIGKSLLNQELAVSLDYSLPS